MISRITLLQVLILGAVTVAGCGGGGGGGSSTPGTPIASLSPGSVAFPVQALSSSSVATPVTLKNVGGATLILPSSPISITGSNAADFSLTSNCGSSLAVNASCQIDVVFSPITAGSKLATLNVASNAAGSPTTAALSGTGTVANALAVHVSAGPPGTNVANIAYASVTFCTPGNANQCATVDHIQIDTGSIGLRVIKSALDAASGSTVVPSPVIAPTASGALFECVTYADGYTWGSVALADVQIGARKIQNLAIHVIGAANSFGGVPSSCSTSAPIAENTVAQFGANGILGIGSFLQDCGFGCESSALAPYYFQCPTGSGCTPVAVPVAAQIWNPIAKMSTDKNGALLLFPSVAAPGAASLDGTIYFGVNTQANNAIGSANWYTMPATGIYAGTITTTFEGTALQGSFVDSGSNAYFFDSATLTKCGNTSIANGFYCPSGSSSRSATISGGVGGPTPIVFTIDNASSLFSNNGADYVFPNLGGTNAGFVSLSGLFDWGLPFFFGRPVFVLIENEPDPAASGVTGPALAF